MSLRLRSRVVVHPVAPECTHTATRRRDRRVSKIIYPHVEQISRGARARVRALWERSLKNCNSRCSNISGIEPSLSRGTRCNGAEDRVSPSAFDNVVDRVEVRPRLGLNEIRSGEPITMSL